MGYALAAYVGKWVVVIALAIALLLLGVRSIAAGPGALVVDAVMLPMLIPLCAVARSV